MKQYNIEINEGELNNLKIFLSRVDLKGNEVPAFVEIMNALNKPIEGDDSGI